MTKKTMTMTKKTMATIGVWILAAASAAFLGHVMSSEPTAAAAPAPVQTAAAPVAAPEKAPEVLPEIVIVAPRPKARRTAPKAKSTPCQDGETRVVGALWAGKNGATGERTVTLRCR